MGGCVDPFDDEVGHARPLPCGRCRREVETVTETQWLVAVPEQQGSPLKEC